MLEWMGRLGVCLAAGVGVKIYRWASTTRVKAPPAGPKARMQYIRLREKDER